MKKQLPWAERTAKPHRDDALYRRTVKRVPRKVRKEKR
jgi:hypothetical protein